MSEPAAWRVVDGGLAIAVRVTPRGGRDALTAGTPEHLAARLAAAPVDGAANAALIALVGTLRGMQVRTSSRELGRLTTVAVVQSIFLVILADAVFAVIFMELDI